LAAVLTLALGIGGNIAMFSLLNAVLLKPLPYPDAGRLVFINEIIPKRNPPKMPVKASYVLHWRTRLHSFESMGAAMGTLTSLAEGKQTESLETLSMTAEFLDVLGERPQLGRWFRRGEEENGQPDVVILSDALWRRRFAADPHIVGRKIVLDGQPYEVVGVTPVGMPFYKGQIEALLPERPEIFIPLRVSPGELDLTTIGSRFWCAAIGRLKHGVTLEQAAAEIEVSMATFTRLNREHIELHSLMQPLGRALVGDNRKGLLVLMASVGFVLLIVCVNIANLILVRATRMRHELSIRAALGASRRHLIGQSLAESLSIAVAGTMLGLLVALWIIDFVIAGAPAQLPRLEAVTLDENVLAFSLGLCVLTTILFGSLPAWRMSKISSLDSLQSAGRWQTEGPHGSRLRALLVGAEAGLTTLLLIGAGLLLTSLGRVMNVSRGFDTENIHAMALALPPDRYKTLEQKVSFFHRVDELAADVVGTGHSGYANGIPYTAGGPGGWRMFAVKEGNDNAPFAELPLSSWLAVSSGYIPTMEIPLRSGRLFADREPSSAVVVSETAARRIWPGENPIGKKVHSYMDSTKDHWYTVIGVVGDVHSTALDKPADCVIYFPYWQSYYSRFTGDSILVLYVRTAMPPAAIQATIRELVRTVDSAVGVNDRGTLTRIMADSVSQRRFQAILTAVFGLIALGLASIGVYGVVSYSVAQRRKEIGVRLVLGANQREVMALVLRHGMTPVLAGMATGLLAATALGRLIGSLLFEVRPLDPFIFASAPLLLALLAALACYLPARRGARADPMVALRYE
jgi:putative ABC transport system permease protein